MISESTAAHVYENCALKCLNFRKYRFRARERLEHERLDRHTGLLNRLRQPAHQGYLGGHDVAIDLHPPRVHAQRVDNAALTVQDVVAGQGMNHLPARLSAGLGDGLGYLGEV